MSIYLNIIKMCRPKNPAVQTFKKWTSSCILYPYIHTLSHRVIGLQIVPRFCAKAVRCQQIKSSTSFATSLAARERWKFWTSTCPLRRPKRRRKWKFRPRYLRRRKWKLLQQWIRFWRSCKDGHPCIVNDIILFWLVLFFVCCFQNCLCFCLWWLDHIESGQNKTSINYPPFVSWVFLGLLHFGQPIAVDQSDTGDVSWLSRWLCQPITPTRPKWEKLVVEEEYRC